MDRRKPSWEMSQKELMKSSDTRRMWAYIIGLIVALIVTIIILKAYL